MSIHNNSKAKRQRSPNWETNEKKLLMDILGDYLDVIENKNTDTNTNKLKSQTWLKVTERFNQLNMRQRTLVELRTQWRLCKVEAKKKAIVQQNTMNKTGGSSTSSPDRDPLKIEKMLQLEFDVDQNNFDSEPPPTKEPDVITEQKLPTKRPYSEGKVSSQAQQIADTTKSRNLAVRQCLQEEHELKLAQMRELHWLKLQQSAEAHEWLKEEHMLRIQILHKQLAHE